MYERERVSVCALNAALLLFNDTPTPFFIMIFHNNVQPGMSR